MTQFPSQTDFTEVTVEYSDEQVAYLMEHVSGMSERETELLWHLVQYHTTLMAFGYDVPKIQAGGKMFPLQEVA